MDKSEKHHLYKTAAAKWGKHAQVMVFLEEIAELQQALAKAYRTELEKNEPCTKNIAEEIADVSIMLEQLTFIYNCENAMLEAKRQKLIRLRERVKG